MHVLIADDQPGVRLAIKLMLKLEPEPIVVEEAADASELLDSVRHCCPKMLLLDWELPGLKPESQITELQASCPGLVIIVLDSRPQTRGTALKAGASGFVGKNDPPEQLLAVVKRCINTGKK